MLHDRSRLETALAPLVGLPLWNSHRAADLQVFHFGAKRIVTSKFGPRKGEESEVGEFALHVQCAWGVRGRNGIVVASGDRYYRLGADPSPENGRDWDWSAPGANRCDERVRDWLQRRSYNVDGASADETGGIVLSLADGFALEVFPDTSLDDEYSEHWRLLSPADLASHFVVSGGGIEP